MYFDQFNALAEQQKQEGRTSAPILIEIKIRSEYTHRYARTTKLSSEIVRELSDEFPQYNVPEALRQIIDHNRS